MISFKGNRPDTAPHRLFILIFLACIKHHCFFCPPFHLHVLHSRSKRNVKRVSASLESFHFTRAKRTWPRRAADRNVSSSWPERASVQSPPAPLLPQGGEIWHFSVAAEPGTCLHWPNSAVPARQAEARYVSCSTGRFPPSAVRRRFDPRSSFPLAECWWERC